MQTYVDSGKVAHPLCLNEQCSWYNFLLLDTPFPNVLLFIMQGPIEAAGDQ